MADKALLINGMIRLLAGTIILRCKSRFFAWSIGEGEDAQVRHLFYEDYTALDHLCDELAIRIGSIGGDVPGAYSILASLSSIKEDQRRPVAQMITVLADDHDQLIADSQFVALLSEDQADPVSALLLLRCIQEHRTCAKKLRRLSASTGSTLH